MGNKQTAVEWLMNNLPSLFVDDSGHYKELFEQAKQMEKEQIVRAFHAACKQDYALEEVREWAEDYISNAYGKRNTPISEGVDQPGLPEGR